MSASKLVANWVLPSSRSCSEISPAGRLIWSLMIWYLPETLRLRPLMIRTLVGIELLLSGLLQVWLVSKFYPIINIVYTSAGIFYYDSYRIGLVS